MEKSLVSLSVLQFFRINPFDCRCEFDQSVVEYLREGLEFYSIDLLNMGTCLSGYLRCVVLQWRSMHINSL